MPKPTSFRMSHRPKGKILIYNFSALDTAGDPVWYLLGVPSAQSEDFLDAIQQSGDVDIKQFGAILASGSGKHPPESICKEIHERYGVGTLD